MKSTIILFMLLNVNFVSAEHILKELEGWQRMTEPVMYQQDNLWEYINGWADLFISYGFAELEAHEFTNGTQSFTLDIYDMSVPINSFGVYMAERSQGESSLKIGTEAVVIPPYQCLYLKDKYYVKIQVFEGKLTSALGKIILENLDKKINGSAEYPQEFKNLPTKNLIEDSYRFVKESYLGLSELKECIVASYENDSGGKYDTFLMLTKNDVDPKKIIGSLSNKWENSLVSGKKIYYRKVPYKGYVGLILLGDKKIYGISGLKDLDTLKQLFLH